MLDGLKIMKKTTLLLLLVGCCASFGLSADVLNINGNRNVVQSFNTPTRGMTKEQVLSRFGEPQSRRAAVGDPPISRWNYSGYSVYFEHNIVLHSLIHR